LRIGPEYLLPMGDMDLAAGQRLDVRVQGTPGCRAWFEIPGIDDSIPMAETPARTQPYWGESVFGVGAVPDSLKIRGVYSGFWIVPDSVRGDSLRVRYHLSPPDRGEVLVELVMPPYDPVTDSALLKYLAMGPDTSVTDTARWLLSLNSERFPFAVEFTDSVQIMRHGPRRGYLAIHQPRGIELLVVGRIGDWYRVRLSESRYGWVAAESVQRLPRGIVPPRSLLRSIRTYSHDDDLTVEFPLSGKHAFSVIEDDRRTIRLLLYGVTSDTDWIRYDFNDDLVDLATWSQPEPGLYEFTLHLTHDIWGYDTEYEGSTLLFRLKRAPRNVWDIRGKRIVIDPGHASDPGAVGPTWLTEAEANLGLALVLRETLEREGAEVIMTREDMSHVDLYDRPAIAKLADADLFISIHNNALPDGVNPFRNNGTSSYYYHPHSINLARAIHRRMLEATGLSDHGLFYGNLAVIRPTQYPAVLVECAFMMIPEQEEALKTDRYRYRVADAIREGIEDFLRGYADANR
jgi:N-acetylmuramoyl-L-alanine amidase